MLDPLYILILLAIAATVVVLTLGIGGFAKGGKFNQKNGNKLMRLRLLMQFIAVVLIALFIYLRQNGGQ